MSDPFQYIFRSCCDPGFNDKAETEALLRYVDEAHIDDVAVFANVEEINTGHMSFEEQDAYLAMMRSIRDALAKKGVTMSVNQWHSVMHADLGKQFRPDQKFRPMVDVEGNAAKLCVCPLCAEWQTYIAQLYARYAQLEPSILWVEDDFRLHNHEPLVWGGCFCEEHMRLYSERAGKKLTRQEFLAGVLRPGEPHSYRKIWLDVSRETMLSAAQAIGQAVRAVSAQAKVGLMSSAPHVHAAEGRDWHAILYTLAAGRPPVNRIHLPGYQEVPPSTYMHGMNMVSMLTRAMIPAETEVYPELENYPYSLFSKSRRFTRFQLLAGLPLDLAGITIDLYDLNGNGIVWADGYQDMLRKVKPYLNDLTRLGVFKQEKAGVRVLYSPLSSYTLHTKTGASMEELYPHENFFAGLLPAMGVPYVYCDDAAVEGQVVAVSGQALRNWDEAQLTRLFRNNFVILNADAAWTLCDMGLGHLAGIQSAQWMAQNSGAYSYEQVVNGETYCEHENARASAIMLSSDALDVAYAPGTALEEYTALFDSFRKRTAHGQVVVDGRVLIYPFGNFDAPASIPSMLLNSLRQAILQQILQRSGRLEVPIVENTPYLEPYCTRCGEQLYLYLLNASNDPVDTVKLYVGPLAPKSVQVLPSEGESCTLPCQPANGRLQLPLHIGAMESVLLTFSL